MAVLGPIYFKNYFVHKELVSLWYFQPTKLFFYFNEGLKAKQEKS